MADVNRNSLPKDIKAAARDSTLSRINSLSHLPTDELIRETEAALLEITHAELPLYVQVADQLGDTSYRRFHDASHEATVEVLAETLRILRSNPDKD